MLGHLPWKIKVPRRIITSGGSWKRLGEVGEEFAHVFPVKTFRSFKIIVSCIYAASLNGHLLISV